MFKILSTIASPFTSTSKTEAMADDTFFVISTITRGLVLEQTPTSVTTSFFNSNVQGQFWKMEYTDDKQWIAFRNVASGQYLRSSGPGDYAKIQTGNIMWWAPVAGDAPGAWWFRCYDYGNYLCNYGGGQKPNNTVHMWSSNLQGWNYTMMWYIYDPHVSGNLPGVGGGSAESSALKEELDAKEKALKAREDELSTREKDFTDKEASSQKQRDDIEAREKAVADKEQNVQGREDELNAREKDFTDRDASSQKQKDDIDAREKAIADKEQNMQGREKEVADKEASLKAQNDDIESKDKALAERTEKLEQREQAVSDKEAGNNDSGTNGSSQVADLQNRLQETQRELDQAKAAQKRQADELEQLKKAGSADTASSNGDRGADSGENDRLRQKIEELEIKLAAAKNSPSAASNGNGNGTSGRQDLREIKMQTNFGYLPRLTPAMPAPQPPRNAPPSTQPPAKVPPISKPASTKPSNTIPKSPWVRVE